MPGGIMSIFSKLAVAVVVGFLGALPFTSASGLISGLGIEFSQSIALLTFVSGFILFVLTLALLGPLSRLALKTVDALGRVEERPGPNVTLGMLGFGTLCAIASVLIQYNALPTKADVTMNVRNSGIAFQSSGSSGLGLLTLLTFLLGASMIGLGIWASLKPAATTATLQTIKPKAPEFDESLA
jgi:hypothetical protein